MEAKKQAKIYSRKRTPLETVIPLETPFSVEIDVCSVCNLACAFCFHSDAQAVKTSGVKFGMMEMSLFRKIVEDLKRFPSPIKKIRLFEFGEPLLNPNLPQMIRELWQAGVTEYVEITTNGVLLTPELNQKLIDAGVSRINISINGTTEQKYKELCQRSIKLDALKANLRHLFENRKNCHIYIKMADSGDLPPAEAETFYAEFGNLCDEIFIERISPIWRDTDVNERIDDTVGPYGQKLTYKRVCPLIFTRMVVNFDGIVVACCVDWMQKYIVGHAATEDIYSIWNGDKLKNLQVRHLRGERESIELCRGCTALMSCTIDDIDSHAAQLLSKYEFSQGRRT